MTTSRYPFVDEHSTIVAAPPDAVWRALTEAVEGAYATGFATRYAHLIGCDPATATGPRPLAEGATLPGFRVVTATPPTTLALAGAHRFSSYTLTFHLTPLTPHRSQLRAETRAAFPGTRGGLYRHLVIGTSIHSYLLRRLLAGVGRRVG
ncbi:hypothetical protein ACFXAZ_25750 [Streptomyces sp. NPDC059477]|uniref:hypothetical protein n=1 Tax=Streptomyces sp. NPDC059477 TaxID=3346847 RepID=UPI0036C1DEFF